MLAEFWSAALGYTKHDYAHHYAAHPEWEGRFALDRRPAENTTGPTTLHFQRASETKVGKNRLHLDLFSDDVPAEVRRLTALGARVIEEKHDFDDEWTVLGDPQGNEFCVGWLPGSSKGRSGGSTEPS